MTWNLSAELDAALRQPQLAAWPVSTPPSNADAAAAYRLAVAIGRCRLFAFQPDDQQLDVAMLWPLADGAIRGAHQNTLSLIGQTERLPDDLLQADTPFERHDLVIDILRGRLDLHAALQAVTEAAVEGQGENETPPPLFDIRLETWTGVVACLDQVMEAHEGELSLVRETAWAGNVARRIDPDRWVPLPWWLTNRAAEIYEETKGLVRDIQRQALRWDIRLEPVDIRVGGAVRPASNYFRQAVREDVNEMKVAAHGPVQHPTQVVAQFRTEVDDIEIECEVRMDRDWSDVRPDRIPDELELVAIYSVRRALRSAKLEPSRWLITWGPATRQLHLPEAESGRFVEATITFRMEELRYALQQGAWPAMTLRRLE